MSAAVRRVGLLFGGASVEHEVSVVSARGVAAALDPARFACVPLAVAGDGSWLSPEASARILESGAARVEPGPGDDGLRLAATPGGGLVAVSRDGAARRLAIDVVFPVVHGWGGEDGRVQGLLELAGIPCVGAGVLGSAAGMDKAAAKAIFEHAGLPVGPWRLLRRESFLENRERACRALGDALGFPLFVKPANGGSSVGITKVKGPEALDAALQEAFSYDAKAVIERGLDAREIECAVLGNDRPRASIVGEIVPSGEFYDYASKYLDGSSRLLIPAPLPEGTAERVRDLAVRAFSSLDLAGMARVDFFVERASGAIWLNEVNTLPGFTPISMYPKLWEASGLSYPELLGRLLELALERSDAERRRASRWSGSGARS